MSDYTITDQDFNECIGDWLNADNPNFQNYVKGIKLFKEYLEEKNQVDVSPPSEVPTMGSSPSAVDASKAQGHEAITDNEEAR